jgi:hypothetical protein
MKSVVTNLCKNKKYSIVTLCCCLIVYFLMSNQGYAGETKKLSEKTTTFLGVIKKISILTDRPMGKRWRVEVTVIKGNGETLEIHDTVVLYLYGIVRVFGGLEEEIKGKVYEITLLGSIDKDKEYSGRVIASSTDWKPPQIKSRINGGRFD